MKHHASHTRTAHHHGGKSEHMEHTSGSHASHRMEHCSPKMHTAHSEPKHHSGGACESYPSGSDPKHDK